MHRPGKCRELRDSLTFNTVMRRFDSLTLSGGALDVRATCDFRHAVPNAGVPALAASDRSVSSRPLDPIVRTREGLPPWMTSM